MNLLLAWTNINEYLALLARTSDTFYTMPSLNLNPPDTYKKHIALLIGASSFVKLIVAYLIGLGNDEVYYWTYALHLNWSYFDHPPFVAWLIRVTTLDLTMHNEVFVRLGAILASAGSTWIIYRIGSIIKDERTGWYAALLFTASIYSSIIAGLFILPDSPQAFFWFWAVYLLIKILQQKDDRKLWSLWLLFGLASGLCILCKVHGIFLWLGVGIYALLFNRSWFRNTWMYFGGVITLILMSPIVIWNFQNDFITYTFHSSRVAIQTTSINTLGFYREIFGQFFYNNPINFLLIWVSIWHITQKKNFSKWCIYTRLMLCCFLPLIFTLLFLALFRDTLPHWSGPSYSGLLILAALYLADLKKNSQLLFPPIIKWSLSLITIIVIAGVFVVNFYPGTLSPNKAHIGAGDPTLDMYGWDQFGLQMDSIYRKDRASGMMPPDSRIIISKWFPAAHIDYYVSTKTNLNTYALGTLFDLHEYALTNKFKKPLHKGDCAYFIQPSTTYQDEFPEKLDQYFEQIDKDPIVLTQYRGGGICRLFLVFRLKNFKPTNNMFDSFGALK